ncbi:AAA family ATPase, partial [Chloroflexota bacterium]
MGIRIQRIKVNRGGPLEEDFVLEPTDLNLVYGHNESGKTYIVESIINLLFKTGRGATVNWGLREWDLAGRIVASGLRDEKVEFTPRGRKLDDYWTEDAGLPRDMSSLLVVKAGETRLRQEGDGVGRDILKDCLSGEGILDKIERGISATLRNSTLKAGRICGANRGELKNRDQLRDELEKIDTLLRDVQEGYASADIFTLQQEQARIEAEVETLQRAKRYHAGQLYNKMLAEKLQREALPSEQDLSELEQDIRAYEEKSATADTKSAGLKDLKATTDDFTWTEKALAEYQEIAAQPVSTAPKLVYISLALALLAGAAAVLAALLGLTIPLIVCAVISMAFTILLVLSLRRTLSTAGYSLELENLKAEFQSRFGTSLTDKATLQVQLDRLRKDHFSAEALSRELEEDLLPDIRTRENSISLAVRQLTGKSVSPRRWRKVLSKVRKRIKTVDESISKLDRELASLDVLESAYLSQHPGMEWDLDRDVSL